MKWRDVKQTGAGRLEDLKRQFESLKSVVKEQAEVERGLWKPEEEVMAAVRLSEQSPLTAPSRRQCPQ